MLETNWSLTINKEAQADIEKLKHISQAEILKIVIELSNNYLDHDCVTKVKIVGDIIIFAYKIPEPRLYIIYSVDPLNKRIEFLTVSSPFT